MKKQLSILLTCIALVAVLVACTTTQQGKALNTLSSLELTTTAAYDSYVTLVVKGQIPTNNVPIASKSFNDFQAAMLVATVAVQANTNALAPQNLVDESIAVINLINTFKGGK